MNRVTKILALPIVDIAKGVDQGRAGDMLINQESGDLYLILEKETPGELQLLPAADLKGVGEHYLLIADQEVLKSLYEDDNVINILRKSYRLLDSRVVDGTGNHLGEVADLILDEGHRIAAILLQDGREIGGDKILSVCHGLVFVEADPPETVLREETSVPVTKEPVNDLTEEKDSLPLGLTLQMDITSADGQFQMKKGSIITAAVLEEAEAHDALLQLAAHAE